MCLTLPPLSFDDNNVLKKSIEYTNICSSVHDHKQKFISRCRFWKNKEEQWNLQKKTYVASQSLKTTRVWRPSEAEDHQSLKIGSCSLLKLVILKTHHCRRNRSLEQRLIQRNLKAFDVYPLNSAEKGHSTIVQPLLHSSCLQ